MIMKHIQKVFKTAAIVIALLAIGQSALAQSSFSISSSTSGTTTTFTIKRTSNTSATETVTYRTVSLSAIAGKHFTPNSGELTFDSFNNTFTVQVQETQISTLDPEYKNQYQASTRNYALEVLDATGFRLAWSTRDIDFGNGYSYQDGKVNQSINDLVRFNSVSGDFASYVNADKYVDVNYSISSNSNHVTSGGYFKIDDEYYYGKQTLCNVPTASLISTTGVSRDYLNKMGAKIYATVCFTMKEQNDGYQYIQILTDNSTSWDCNNSENGENAGELKKPSISIYKALFELSKSGSDPVTSDNKMFFPHKSDDNYNTYEFKYSDAWMYSQKFKNSENRATNSGSLVLEPKVETINVRFDCAGKDNDTWWVKDLFVRMALCDDVAPTITSTNDITLSAGPYNRGNTFYISVPFSEIVKITGNPRKLATTWGDAYYESGEGTNVLTFKGTINANAGTVLEITGKSGTITDIAGNEFSGSLNKTFNGVTCASPIYTITYDLNGSNEAVANPTTYTYETATFTLTNPTWTGYVFTGWTGSNGTTPQTTVTVNTHSHGDLTYTANWTEVWDMSSNPDGSQDHPYIINTPEDLVYLANIVNSTTHGYSGTYFKLGADIDMSGYDNFTAIGSDSQDGTDHYFNGFFDGQGHIISNLHINSSVSYVGLFGFLYGTVENVIVDGANITGKTAVGAIAGRVGGGGSVNGHVKNCRVFNSTITVEGNFPGVIAGQTGSDNNVSNSHYRNCTLNGTVNSDLFTITTTGNATASGTPNTTYNSVDYYTSGQTVTLGYSPSSEGITITYKAKNANNTDITSSAISGNILTMPGSDVTISATATTSTTYIDADGNIQTVTAQPLEGGETELGVNGQETWYVVNSDVYYDHQVKLKGIVHLILSDGHTMTMTETEANNWCIYGNGNNLTIYGQSGGTGALTTTNENGSAISADILTINGGHITATAKNSALSSGTSVTINGGVVEATSSSGYPVNVRSNQTSTSITINGGSVKALSPTDNGLYTHSRSESSIIINGGQVEASSINCSGSSYGLIVLGYTNASDYITSGSYSETVHIADGQTMTDGTNTYSNALTLDEINAIAGKTLSPYIAESPNITLVQGEKGGVTCYWGTFYHGTLRYTLPEGAAAYTMGADHRLYRLGADGRVIPAGVAVVIIAENNSIVLSKNNETSEIAIHGSGNILLGNDAATAVTAGKVTVGGQQKTPYLLSVKNNIVDFYPLSSDYNGSIPHNKAYYVVDATQ